MLKGEFVYLRKTIVEDAEESAKWLNDEEVIKFLGITEAITPENRKQFLQKKLKDPTEHIFSIIQSDTNKYIGNVYLYKIDEGKKDAEIGIFIGDKTCWKKGCAKEAVNLITEYGFKKLGLKKIYAKIIENNIAAIKCFEKSKFTKESTEYNRQNKEKLILLSLCR